MMQPAVVPGTPDRQKIIRDLAIHDADRPARIPFGDIAEVDDGQIRQRHLLKFRWSGRPIFLLRDRARSTILYRPFTLIVCNLQRNPLPKTLNPKEQPGMEKPQQQQRRQGAGSPPGLGVAATTLARVPSLARLPDPVLEQMAGRLKTHRYDKGDTIVRHNDASRDFYIIISGAVRVSLVGTTGRSLTYQILPAGEMFGEIAAVDGQGRSADVIAEEDTVLGSLSSSAFLDMARTSPDFALLIVERLARLNRRLTSRLFEYHAYDVRGRVYLELLRLTEADHEAPITITDRDMASRVGTTRENVSRIHGSLRDSGMIRRDKSLLRVLDRTGLEALLNDCEFG
jgi:CRP-like cAMP-binding protein